MADSGRGSWTSCSSNSHDSFQSLPASSCRPWDHGVHGHPLALAHRLAGTTIAEADAARDSELAKQSRQSWASSGSLSDTYEGNYGTVKRRNTGEQQQMPPGSGSSASPTNDEGVQGTDAAYKTVTSSTEKGLIGEDLAG